MFSALQTVPGRARKLVLVAFALGLSACATTSHKPDAAASVADPALIGKAEKKAQRFLDNYAYADALGIYEGLAKEDPKSKAVQLGIAESQYGLGNLDLARKLFSDLLNDDAYRVRATQGIGLVESMQGNFDTARELFQSALAKDPTLWRSWNGLARCYDFSGEWDKSLDAYEKALKYTHDPAVIYNNIALSLMAQERYDEALVFLEEGMKSRPDMEILYLNKRLALALAKRYDEATLGANEEESAKLLNNAGYVALLQRDYATAEALFNRAIEVSPSYYAIAHQNLKILEKVRKKYGA